MANLVIIGGPGRVGKSTLARYVRTLLPTYPTFSLDAWTACERQRGCLQEWDAANIRCGANTHPRDEVAMCNSLGYVEWHVSQGSHLICDGLYWPDIGGFLWSEFSREGACVHELYLVRRNSLADEITLLGEIAKHEPKRWLGRVYRERGVEGIEAYAREQVVQSERMVAMCEKFGVSYVDVAGLGYEEFDEKMVSLAHMLADQCSFAERMSMAQGCE